MATFTTSKNAPNQTSYVDLVDTGLFAFSVEDFNSMTVRDDGVPRAALWKDLDGAPALPGPRRGCTRAEVGSGLGCSFVHSWHGVAVWL